MKQISLDVLDPKSIDAAIEQLESYAAWVEDRTAEFLHRLAQEAVPLAEEFIDKCESDGEKGTIAVKAVYLSDGQIAITAEGDQILFLEFGTGVQTYPDDHPDKPEEIVGRGEYGKKKGRQKTWGFKADGQTPGRYGWNPKTTADVILTHGIPAQKPMYFTVQEVERIAEAIAREVFK